MEAMMMIVWLVLLVALVVLGYAIFAKGAKHRAVMGFVSGIVGLLALFMVLGVDVPYLSTALGVEEGVTTKEVSLDKQYAIYTLKVNTKEKFTNDYTAGNGSLEIYAKGVSPSDANANPILSITISSGKGTDSNASINCGALYRWVYKGLNTYYDKDLGEFAIDCSSVSQDGTQTLFVLPIDDIIRVATIDDICDETAQGSSNCINHASNTTFGTAVELGCTTVAADCSIEYNESTGDGTFDLYLTFAVSGGNEAVLDYSLCFDNDQTNPPAGDEFSAITHAHVTGTDWGIPSALLNHWKNQECILLSKEAVGGLSGEEKLTFSVTHANIDANADFRIVADDLGAVDGKDVLLGTKATKDVVTFAGSASG